MIAASLARKIIVLSLALAIALVPLVYWPSMWDYTLVPKLLTWQLLQALALGVWCLTKNRRFTLPPSGRWAMVFIMAALASALYATDPLAALQEGTKLFAGFVLFLVIANHATRADIPFILTVSVATGLIVALSGIADHLGWRPLHIPSAGLPSATLGFRNIAAMYLIQNLPLAVAMFALARTRRAVWCNALAISAMGAFLVYTRTRGAWVGLACAAAIAAGMWYMTASPDAAKRAGNKRVPLFLALLLAVGLSALPSGLGKLGPQSIDEKKTTINAALTSIVAKGGDRERLTMWRHTLPMIAAYPLFGVGLGNWSVVYPRFDGGAHITFASAPERPHNDPLGILAETGLVGFTCYALFCLAVVRLAWHQMKTPDRQTRWIAAACLTSFTAILVHSAFSFPRERIAPTFFFWLVAGLLAAQNQTEIRRSRARATPVLAVLFLIALGQLAFTARLIDFNAHMHRATQAERKGDWATVARETEAARKAGAFHQEAVYLGGYAFNAEGQFDRALNLYRTAERRRPYDIQILNGRAIAAQKMGLFDEAETCYRQALDLIEPLPDVRYNLAGLYLQTGRPQQAATEYARVLKSETPTLDIEYRLALAYLLAKDRPRAIETFQRAFQLAPSSGLAHIREIETLYREHRLPRLAAQCYTIFLAYWTGDARDIAQRRLAQLEKQTTP